MNKIVIACDSFKGCMTSAETAAYASAGIKDVFPKCDVLSVPVADGGEGTVDALVEATSGQKITCEVNNPLMRPVNAVYGILGDGQTAVVEMAAASGLTLIEPGERNPLLTTTYGTGELINDALSRGCSKFLIGIGGSATNDAGTGMLQALGFRFGDKDGNTLGQGGQVLEQIAWVDSSRLPMQVQNASFTIMCDVGNPFSGVDGAACVFAPQKGADAQMVKRLDAGLRSFADVIKATTGKDIDNIAGAGAAGGMGGGCLAFLDARLNRGVDVILETLGFDRLITGADLIITGEGRLDKQTMMGKTPLGVLQAAKKQNIPVVAIGGSVFDTDILSAAGFAAVLPVLPYPVSLARAMDKEFAGNNVRNTVKQLMQIIGQFGKGDIML